MRHKTDFSTLNDFAFAISSQENFDTVTEWMDNRFIGLPLFHQSIRLKVKRYDKIIANERDTLSLPESIYKMAAPQLRGSLNTLLSYIQRSEGIKNFGLLHLSVKLMPHLFKHEIDNYKNHGRTIPNLVKWLGPRIEVPVLLAVASRKTDTYYESLAIGLNGIDSYASALTLSPSAHKHEYIVQAGLNVVSSLEHMNHSIVKLLNVVPCEFLPGGFFNRYLKNHLIPERHDIVKTLCEYVFHGCQIPNKISHSIEVQPLYVENLISC